MKTTRVVSERLELGEGESKLVVLVDREEGKPPEDVSIQSSWGSVTLPLETLLRVSQAARDWNGFARICPDHGTYADADGVKPYGECPKCAAPKVTPPSPTCSECSGPLGDGMGCTPREGRCGSCVYEGGERARKAREARYEGLTDRQRMSKVLAAEYQREQGEGYGPGREE